MAAVTVIVRMPNDDDEFDHSVESAFAAAHAYRASSRSTQGSNGHPLATCSRQAATSSKALLAGCLAPGFAGLYQVNVKVPAGVSSAYNIPVSLTIGGAGSNRVTIPIQ